MSVMPANPRALPIPTGAAIRTSEAAAFDATRARMRGRVIQHPFTGVSSIGLDMSSLVEACQGYEPLLRSIECVRVGAESRPETLLRLCIVDAGLPEPEVGVAVPVATGTVVLHPDLAYPGLRIAIEYEGERHRDPGRWERDIERRELFEDAGWRVIRVTAAGLADPAALIDRIRRVRTTRAAEFAGHAGA
jgi:hypothetical protein